MNTKRIRVLAAVDQLAIAKAAGVSGSALCLVEKGRLRFSEATARQVRQALRQAIERRAAGCVQAMKILEED